jgi:hypothetical protein
MKYKVKIVKAPQQETEEMKYGGQQGFGLDIGSRRIYTDYTPDPYTTGISTHLGAVPREEANIEAEKGETALVPTQNGLKHFNIGGNRHVDGGTPLNVPQGTFIYSDTKKMKLGGSVLGMFGKSPESKNKYTPAQLAKQYDLNKYTAILNDPNADPIKKRTAELMIQNNQTKLAQLALVQEGKKGYPQGIPAVAKGYMEKLESKMQPQQEQMEMSEEASMMYGGMYQYGGGLMQFDPGGYVPYGGNKVGNVYKTDYTPDEISSIARRKGYAGDTSNLALQQWINSKGKNIPVDEKVGEITMNALNSLPNIDTELEPINTTSATTPSQVQATPTNQQSAFAFPAMGPTASYPGDPNDYKDNSITPGTATAQKSKIKYGWTNPDKLAMANELYNLGSIKKYTPWAPATPHMVTADYAFYSPERALAENAGLAGDMARANAMLAGSAAAGRLANTGLYGKAADSAASIVGKYAGLNTNIANTAAETNASLANKELLMGWQRAKDLYDAGVISNQQYDNATRAARAAAVKQYGQGWNNASTIYNMNRTESPYYAIDPASGRLAFHSPRAEQDFYNSKSGQGQDPLAMYDQLRKTYGDERAMELWKTMYGKSSGRGNTTTTTKTANGTTRKTTYDDES